MKKKQFFGTVPGSDTEESSHTTASATPPPMSARRRPTQKADPSAKPAPRAVPVETVGEKRVVAEPLPPAEDVVSERLPDTCRLLSQTLPVRSAASRYVGCVH